MESWRETWRNGVAKALSLAGLAALKAALEADDQALLQGATCMPPPLACFSDWPVEACCPIAYLGWKGDGLVSVADVEEAFARACYEVDQALGEPAACRWFINWADTTPRDEMRRELLAEVELTLAGLVALERES